MVPTPILVVGASGTVGSHLAPLLLRRGHLVRAATRRGPHGSAATGLETVRLDLGDAASHAAALAEVAAAYLLVPAGIVDAAALLGPFVAAAASRGVKIVLQSAQGADQTAAGASLRRLERQVEGAGVAHVILRCGWFMDNFHTLWRGALVERGSLALPAGDASCAFIAATDIAAAAAVVLTERRWDGRALTLTGPAALGFAAAVAAIADSCGRPLAYQPVDDEAFVAGVVGGGGTPAYAHFLAALFAQVRAGGAAAVSDAVHKVTGAAPQTFADYAALHSKAWSHG